MCTILEDKEIDEECESHNEYEVRVIDYMARMTQYLESKTCREHGKQFNNLGAVSVLSRCPEIRILNEIIKGFGRRSSEGICNRDPQRKIWPSKFYDQVVGHVRSVEAMGEKFNSEILAPVWFHSLLTSYQQVLLEKWERDIEQVIRAKESSQLPSVESKPLVSDSAWKDSTPKSYPPRRSTTSALVASNQEECSKLVIHLKSCQKPPCKHCRGRHHSLLHSDPFRPGPSEEPFSPRIPPSTAASHVVASSIAANGVGKVVLQNYPSLFCVEQMATQKLFDVSLIQVSQTSFVRQSVVEELGLDGKSVRIAVSGFGGET
ncbi:hypothetical protein OS493_015238 [Desmophyllum pertusum]|uniref:Uncharacterized protein n=1 Tax=Desmophyllum pertusum TaxID=174260 RepID=A0A9W9ZD32_9CNID|nr:hypothetical protein OS493_015238 [Desmophyllum pertusum]